MSAPRKIGIFGATSGIAEAIARELAANGDSLVLCARNSDELDSLASDLRLEHNVSVATLVFEATEFSTHQQIVQQCIDEWDQPLDGVILCQGFMADQQQAQADFSLCHRMIEVNYTSMVSLCEAFATYFEERKVGFIAAISSVAGNRGRQSNYLYGATKGALSTYLQGLRNRMHHQGVAVLTILPGFVATEMTAGILDPNSPMVAAPEKVARDIVRSIGRKSNVRYTPWFWWPIMTIIGSIPEWIFKRLKM